MSAYTSASHFLSADWGTTHLRLRLVQRAEVRVLATHKSTSGCRQLGRAKPGPAREAAYRQTLLEVVGVLAAEVGGDLSALPVVISGMASSSLGWRELPYAAVPFPVNGSGLESTTLTVDGVGPVLLLSGVATDRDVMRGEETELLGLLAHPEFSEVQDDAVVIMPGTHCKHVDVTAGQIETFQTAMSGELYQLLAESSTLSGAVAGAGSEFTEEQRHGFLDGVHVGLETPMPQSLFTTRALSLLKGWSADRCAGFLSGVIIAHELMAFDPETLVDLPVIIFADADMGERYRIAFDAIFAHGLYTGDIPKPIVSSPECLTESVVHGHLIALEQKGV